MEAKPRRSSGVQIGVQLSKPRRSAGVQIGVQLSQAMALLLCTVCVAVLHFNTPNIKHVIDVNNLLGFCFCFLFVKLVFKYIGKISEIHDLGTEFAEVSVL